jgi:predicted amidohydrolase YtcJ
MKRILPLFVLLVCLGCATSRQSPPDLILVGGRVFTGDDTSPWSEAIAIRGDSVMAVGESATISALAGPSTRTIDLQGRLVIPGINDAHVHAPWTREPLHPVTLPEEGLTKQSLLAAVRAAVPAAAEGMIVSADLPAELVDSGITRDDLDAISSTQPIRLSVFGGHSAVLNTAALRRWGIADDASDPVGGWYGRKDGRLNGWLYEHALWVPQQKAMQSASDEVFARDLAAFEQEALGYGITSVQTMPVIPAERVGPILQSINPRLRWRIIDFRLPPFDGAVRGFPVKYVLDGTPIERSAAMLAAYSDDPSTSGRLNYGEAEVEEMVRKAAEGQQQLLVHAVGDRSIATLLERMRRVPADWPSRRVRIEHGDMMTPALAKAARELGVIVVQNPAHFTIPGVIAPRYGARAAQPARSLLEQGNRFAIGSDGPLNPFLNIFFAVIHPTNAGEALSVEQALRAYTAGAAFAEFEERRKGKLMPGMLADLAVLSQDIFNVPPPELPKTTSVMTIINGKIVHSAGGS